MSPWGTIRTSPRTMPSSARMRPKAFSDSVAGVRARVLPRRHRRAYRSGRAGPASRADLGRPAGAGRRVVPGGAQGRRRRHPAPPGSPPASSPCAAEEPEPRPRGGDRPSAPGRRVSRPGSYFVPRLAHDSPPGACRPNPHLTLGVIGRRSAPAQGADLDTTVTSHPSPLAPQGGSACVARRGPWSGAPLS